MKKCWLRRHCQDVTTIEKYLHVLDSFTTIDNNFVATENLTDCDIIDGVVESHCSTKNLSSDNENGVGDEQVKEPFPNYSYYLLITGLNIQYQKHIEMTRLCKRANKQK